MSVQSLAKENNRLAIQKNRMIYVVGVLGMVNVFLAASVYCLIGKERVVVVPPVMGHEFWVATDAVSDSYLEQMSSFFASLVLNVNPSNFAKRTEQLLQHVDSASYASVKAQMMSQEQDIVNRALTSSFHPVSFKIDRRNMIVELKGELNLVSGNTQIGSGMRVYQIQYAHRHGKLFILTFKEVKHVE